MIRRREREKFIEENPIVATWIEGLAGETQRYYVPALINYSKFHGMTPQELLDLKENGGKQTAQQLLSYYPDQRDDFPYGRYCCGFCKAQREPL